MSLAHYTTLILPFALAGGLGVVVSRTLRVSCLFTLFVLAVPFGLPSLQSWLYPGEALLEPELLMVIGWICGLVGLALWSALRPLLGALIGKFGAVRIAHGALLLLATFVSVLLVIEPSKIGDYVPFWSTGLGLSLLGATLVSMLLALVRTLRASLFFVIWSFVSVVLASELFLHKPLFNLSRSDVARIMEIDSASLDALSSQPRNWVNGVVDRFFLRSNMKSAPRVAVDKNFLITDASLDFHPESLLDSST